MNLLRRCLPAAASLGALLSPLRATNPLILDQFTADPTARVFEGRVYVYPSHDILATPGHGRPGWFCMEDYHVFSSENLTDWQDHGVIVRQTGVPWAAPDAYAMWAPDCVEKGGKYYFYFPALPKEGKGFRIGVALADHPAGPFTPGPAPIEGVHGIDPCVLLDRDGGAYLYYAARKIFVARLKDNLREVATPPQPIANLPEHGLIEGPFVFERNGIYYLTYPHVEHKTERLEYATGPSPLGPFQPAGVILDEAASGCWTVHQSIVRYRGEWYLFYHDKDLSPDFDKTRAIRADRLVFEDDGRIRKVVPTLRGVGVVDARREIQLDRFSATSPSGVSVSFLDPARPGLGWKVTLAGAGNWVRFNEVDFGRGGLGTIEARVRTPAGGSITVHRDGPDGPELGHFVIPTTNEWTVLETAAINPPSGVRDLVATAATGGPVEIDWVRFR